VSFRDIQHAIRAPTASQPDRTLHLRRSRAARSPTLQPKVVIDNGRYRETALSGNRGEL
jgi:hypothetical protein